MCEKYKPLFGIPWCVIFGEPPGDFLSEREPLSEVCKVINEACEVFGLLYDYSRLTTSNFPTSEEIVSIFEDETLEDLTVNDVIMLRDIFRLSKTIRQYAGRIDEGRSVHLKEKEILVFARQFVHRNPDCAMAKQYPEQYRYTYQIEDCRDSWIYAALAIKAAYRAAEMFVMYSEKLNLSEAYVLLGFAKKRELLNKHQKKKENLEKEIEYLTPLAEKEEKAQKARKLGGKMTATSPELLDLWQKECERLKAKGHTKMREIGRIIASKHGGSAETIRRKIK